MPDRIDIDALLIGALYGELTPADEALLTAHLESHPADRTALADLTRTRAAVRDSRLLAVQLEPPQAISALLLQEASRRAPRPAARDARDRETASWFQRFVRSFMAHPAMAAAAMLVLVVGVAGTFYLRGTDLVVESPPPQVSVARSVALPKPEVTPITPPTAPAGTAAPAPEPGGALAEDRVSAGSAAGTGAVAGNDGYRVGLDDVARAQPELAKQDQAGGRGGGEKAKAADIAEEAQAPAAMKPATRSPAGPAPTTATTQGDKLTRRPGKKLAGIVVQTPEMSPRELKESDDEAPDRARRQSLGGDRDLATATGRITRGAGATAPGGVPPAPAAAMPAPPPSIPDQAGQAGPEPVPALEPRAVPKKGASSDAKSEAPAKKPAPKPMPTMPPSAPSVAPPPPPANDSNRFAKAAGPAAKDAAGPDKALLDWARKRHERVKSLVSSNNCRAAASAATEIYSRAPDYYAANVVTDRTIKPCLAYINTEREREDRVRAAKNAAASDSAAPASPPTRK